VTVRIIFCSARTTPSRRQQLLWAQWRHAHAPTKAGFQWKDNLGFTNTPPQLTLTKQDEPETDSRLGLTTLLQLRVHYSFFAFYNDDCSITRGRPCFTTHLRNLSSLGYPTPPLSCHPLSSGNCGVLFHEDMLKILEYSWLGPREERGNGSMAANSLGTLSDVVFLTIFIDISPTVAIAPFSFCYPVSARRFELVT